MSKINQRMKNIMQRNKIVKRRYHTENTSYEDQSPISILPIIKNYKSQQQACIINNQIDAYHHRQIGQALKVNLRDKISCLQSLKYQTKNRMNSLSNKHKISLLLNRSVNGKSKYVVNKINKIRLNQSQDKEQQYGGIILNSISSSSQTLKCLQLDVNRLKFKRIQDQLYRACTDGDLEQYIARRNNENIEQQNVRETIQNKQVCCKQSYSFRFNREERNSIKNIRQKIKSRPCLKKKKFIEFKNESFSPWQIQESNFLE